MFFQKEKKEKEKWVFSLWISIDWVAQNNKNSFSHSSEVSEKGQQVWILLEGLREKLSSLLLHSKSSRCSLAFFGLLTHHWPNKSVVVSQPDLKLETELQPVCSLFSRSSALETPPWAAVTTNSSLRSPDTWVSNTFLWFGESLSPNVQLMVDPPNTMLQTLARLYAQDSPQASTYKSLPLETTAMKYEGQVWHVDLLALSAMCHFSFSVFTGFSRSMPVAYHICWSSVNSS